MRNVWLRVGVCVGVGLSIVLAPRSRADAQVIGTNNILNGAVTTPKLANAAVTNPKIGNLAVTGTKIANYAVTAAKIAANAVTPDKVAFYGRVIVVAPSGGDFTSPVAAMNAITDASETKPYLVKIMPGNYSIGGGTVQMKPYVDIEGSGQRSTRISGTQNTCLDPLDPTNPRPRYGVVTGSRDAGLRHLVVENTGAAACAVTAILAADCDGMVISNVSTTVEGSGFNAGIVVRNSGTDGDPVWITDVDVYAGGGTRTVGIALRGEPASASDEAPLTAVIFNSAVTAGDAPAGNNLGLAFANATGIVLGGVANGHDYALVSDGGSGLVQGTLLLGAVSVRDNTLRPTPFTIANSTGTGSGTFWANNAALTVTNSSFDMALSLLNSPAVTLLNSNLGPVAMDSGTLAAANCSFAGAVTASGGTFKAVNSSLPANADNSGGGTTLCGGVVRTDTLATLSGDCQ